MNAGFYMQFKRSKGRLTFGICLNLYFKVLSIIKGVYLSYLRMTSGVSDFFHEQRKWKYN